MKKILSLVMAVCILTLSLGFSAVSYAAGEEKVYAVNDFGNGMGTVTFSKNANNTLADSDACYIYTEDSIDYSYKNNGALAMKAAGSAAEIHTKISFTEAYTPGTGLVVEYKLKFDNVFGTCPILFQAMNNNTVVGKTIDIDKTDNVMYIRGTKNGTDTNITKWNWGTGWVHFMLVSADGVTGDVYINGTKIDTVELNITSAINAIRLRQKVWTAGRDMYIDEVRITSCDAMKLDEASVNSGANIEGSFVLDFNNLVDSATLSNIKLMQGESEIDASLYSLSIDALDKTRVIVTLDEDLPDGSYTASYSDLWERVWTGEGVMKYTDYDDVSVKKFQRLHVEDTYTLANETIVDFSHVLTPNAASAITVLKNGTEEVTLPISIPSADKTCIKLDTTSLKPGSYTVKYQGLTDITGTKLNGTVTFEKAAGTPEYVEAVTVDGSKVCVDLSANARFLGKTLVVAAYNGNKLAGVKPVTLSNLSNEVTFDAEFDKVKAMVVDSFGTMLPLTVASGK